mgnify:CR=1 FL=1
MKKRIFITTILFILILSAVSCEKRGKEVKNDPYNIVKIDSYISMFEEEFFNYIEGLQKTHGLGETKNGGYLYHYEENFFVECKEVGGKADCIYFEDDNVRMYDFKVGMNGDELLALGYPLHVAQALENGCEYKITTIIEKTPFLSGRKNVTPRKYEVTLVFEMSHDDVLKYEKFNEENYTEITPISEMFEDFIDKEGPVGTVKRVEIRLYTASSENTDTSDTTNLYPPDAVWTAPMMVIINGEEYKYVTEYKGTESTDNIEILGEVKKHVSVADYDWPTEEGTSNFAEVGAKYGRLGDKMLIQYENTWVIIDNY